MKKLKEKRKIWISLIGWTVCYGFIYNFAIQPLIQTPIIDWEYLLISLGIILGINKIKGKKHE